MIPKSNYPVMTYLTFAVVMILSSKRLNFFIEKLAKDEVLISLEVICYNFSLKGG